jgi:predicted GTPase
MKKKVIIMGAAGRDFHNFNVLFRGNKDYNVICFTAEQIPDISGRKYPKELAGRGYPHGIPIYPEEKLAELIKKNNIDEVILSYSDLSYNDVGSKSAIVNAAGADFRLVNAEDTMLKTKKPVIAVTAVRTGVGKSPCTRRIVDLLRRINIGMRIVVVRHPMPYGDLKKQAVQRFSTLEDLKIHNCTVEEMEEYEPHIQKGIIVYAGVDYDAILKQAEKEADIIIWDGGNNDTPFFKSDLHICLADCLRPGHEISYYPGEINLRMASVIIANKSTSAKSSDIDIVMNNIKWANPNATVMKGDLIVSADNPDALRGKRCLVIEDGPTLTHGNMTIGAGVVAVERAGGFLINARPTAVGSLKDIYNKYPRLSSAIPAMGYSQEQLKDLEETIRATQCDVVVIGTPVDLRRLITIDKPTVRVSYQFKSLTEPGMENILKDFAKKHVK